VQDSRLGFSREEAKNLWTGVAVMTVSFSLAYIGGLLNFIDYYHAGGAPLVLVIMAGSFVAVLTAFFMHEFAHKAVAQRYGAVAEFRHSPVGLLVGLVSAAVGMMLAFPGATFISGRGTQRQQAWISAAGPATNLACAAAFIGLSLVLGTAPGRLRYALPILIGAIAFINVLLAMFSLIPIPPVAVSRVVAGRFPVNVSVPGSDGYNVLTASKPIFAALVAALVALGLFGHFVAVF